VDYSPLLLSSHLFQEKQCPREITFFSKPFTSCSGALTIFITIKEKEFYFQRLSRGHKNTKSIHWQCIAGGSIREVNYIILKSTN
jgi:hypothetical protein